MYIFTSIKDIFLNRCKNDYVKLKQKKIKLLLDTGAKLEDSVIPLNRKLGLSKKIEDTDEKCVLINKISLKSLASVQHKTNKIDNSQSMSLLFSCKTKSTSSKLFTLYITTTKNFLT